MLNASDIAKSISDFPNLEEYLNDLVKDVNIETKSFGKEFNYSNSVTNNKYFAHYGMFIDFFIRKHLSNKYQIEIEDARALEVINSEKYDNSPRRLRDNIQKCYKIFIDKDTKAIDIVKSIEILSYSNSLFYGDRIPRNGLEPNEENLLEVMKYFDNLKFAKVDFKTAVGCKYFGADVQLIFDNDTIFAIRTSKFKSLVNDQENIPKSKFFQLFLYSFGFYKKTQSKILKFVIYNTLLGFEHTLILNDINYDLFENALQMDIAEEDLITSEDDEEKVTDKLL